MKERIALILKFDNCRVGIPWGRARGVPAACAGDAVVTKLPTREGARTLLFVPALQWLFAAARASNLPERFSSSRLLQANREYSFPRVGVNHTAIEVQIPQSRLTHHKAYLVVVGSFEPCLSTRWRLHQRDEKSEKSPRRPWS